MTIELKDYQIIKKCSGNGVNKIYIVKHRISNEYFVIKIIAIEEQERQLREIEVHRTLNHKYVVSLIDYDIKENSLILLIEFAKYGDLFGFLRKMKNLDLRKIIKFYYKIIQSVQFLHERKLVHRDIKPENIMITKNFRPKLADFGTSAKKNQILNTFCGTYEYMAPEIFLRDKQTEKVDVWALGILIYEMIYLKTPFKNKNLQEVKNIIKTKSIQFNSNIDSNVPQFIYWVLQLNPKKRPTCKEMLKHPLFNCVKVFKEKFDSDNKIEQKQSSSKNIQSKFKNFFKKKNLGSSSKQFDILKKKKFYSIAGNFEQQENFKSFKHKQVSSKGLKVESLSNFQKKLITSLNNLKFSKKIKKKKKQTSIEELPQDNPKLLAKQFSIAFNDQAVQSFAFQFNFIKLIKIILFQSSY